MTKLALPPAPAGLTGPVRAWSESITLPSYLPAPGDRNPMFLDARVYQGSSGRVYPMAFINRISTAPEMHEWQAIHLENDFLRVMILPEIGGRIHIALDKTNNYDFIYRQNVIKPALVGLAGPWISGGIEFNWPQHHRPATFLPVSVHIQEHPDGARTVWCSDLDPLTRMKGMHGICLYPNRSFIECKVRLFNRTPLRQTFLWWANAAVHVNQHYQSFFPPDVHYVADHARRAVNTYPLATEPYYGVDYPARARTGIPAGEPPSRFAPAVHYAPNDLSWYANIPVPTSYMAVASRGDFLGGYDHARQAGIVHVADHHIAPGKKQWTWGNHDFGYAWDRNLTDNDGPYIELMAGVYTDNQPDFSFLAPYETKTFSQYWYPIQQIGVPQQANTDAALSLQIDGPTVRVGVAVTGSFPAARVALSWRDLPLFSWTCDLRPGQPLVETATLPSTDMGDGLTLTVKTSTGRTLISHTQERPPTTGPRPAAAVEPPPPRKIDTIDQLWVTGLHLAQYRHPTLQPEDYWLEALARDPGDARSNLELGRRHLDRGEFIDAEQRFQTAITRLTERNANPTDGEPFYLLGLTLRYLGRDVEAQDAFSKATWNFAWRAASLYQLAQLDVKAGRWEDAPQRLYESLRLNADNSSARNLAVAVFRQMDRGPQAAALLAETFALDRLDAWARHLAGEPIPGDNQSRLDVACEYLHAGLYSSATEVLTAADIFAEDGSVPLIHYFLAYAYQLSGDLAAAEQARQSARQASPLRCFPYRLEDLLALESAIAADPADGRGFYLLGNWLYGKQRREQAVDCWRIATRLDPAMPTAWRNLGLGLFNVHHDPAGARTAYDQAFEADPSDARVLYERDQLWSRTGVSPGARLAELKRYPALVSQRDDLSLTFAELLHATGDIDAAAGIMATRQFQPWEGGEGLALAQHARTNVALGRRALAAGDPAQARAFFALAVQSPAHLGEARRLWDVDAEAHFWLGEALSALGDPDAAAASWKHAASAPALSEQTLYSALALARLGERRESRNLLRRLWFYGHKLTREKGSVDYFATSLPALLLFDDDLTQRNRECGLYLQLQARIGMGQAKLAKRTLTQLLALDPHHIPALELARQFAIAA